MIKRKVVFLGWALGVLAFFGITVKVFIPQARADFWGQGGTVVSPTVQQNNVLNSSTGLVGMQFPQSYTRTQIIAITPTTAQLGQMFQCSNCTVPFNVCVATGTTLGGFALIGAGGACI